MEEPKKDVDHIPTLGGDHLGEGCQEELCHAEVCYIQPGKEGPIEILSKKTNCFSLAKNILRSFGKAHGRQSTLKEFQWNLIEDKKMLQRHLRIGRKCEGVRKALAYLIHFITLFMFNGRSFSSYYAHQAKRYKVIAA